MKNLLTSCCLLLVLTGWSQAATANLQINATIPTYAGPVCVRAIIQQSDGTIVSGEWGNPGWPPMPIYGKAMDPKTILQVPTGRTTITVGKGPDFFPQTIVTNLSTAGQTYIINFSLKPVLNMSARGWSAGEAHAHYIHGDNQIIRTPTNGWAMAAAGGLNFVSFCEDYLGSGTWTRQQILGTWTPFENTECKLWIGIEQPKNAWGHGVTLLFDPWVIRSSVPYHWGRHSVHQQGGVNIPVHTDRLYPGHYYDDSSTGIRYWFLFPNNNFQKVYPLDTLIGHVMDGWSGVSDEGFYSTQMGPYFKLLQLGYRIPFTADSDFCYDRINNGYKSMGCWVTYYQLDGQPLTRASAINAVRKGRIMGTTGPLVLFSIDGALPGDTLPADGKPHTARIEASHCFSPWTLGITNLSANDICRISEIDLYRNGQIIQSWTPNTTNAVVTYSITETNNNSYYMVRVLGNDAGWMAGFASPIYFDDVPRATHPPVYQSLIQGRLYDSASGNTLTGTVSCMRYGQTAWTIPTDSQGRFQAYVPLDADLVATDRFGRQFTQNIIQYEPAYSFCHYTDLNYPGNLDASIDPFKNIVQTMRWEFPMGYQPAASYVRTNLTTDATSMTNFSVLSAPSPFPGKTRSEIVMVIVDKTQVQPGDTINYAVLFRQPQGQTPSESLAIQCKAWDPNYPRVDNKLGNAFYWDDGVGSLINVGGGFYLRQAAFVAPSWTTNDTPTTAAIRFLVAVRDASSGAFYDDASLLFPVGPTKRQLLVSTTWDGLPATWGERGVGPCNFYRETQFEVRYADYRGISVSFRLNGQLITVRPKVDTAHVADADDAVFLDQFYYDGQCEPTYRNVPFRDPVRTQPPATDFSSVPVQNRSGAIPPSVALIGPDDGAQVPAGVTSLYYFVDDAGLSGFTTASLLMDGKTVFSNLTVNPVAINLAQGTHTWQVQGFDQLGNQGLSPVRTLTVLPGLSVSLSKIVSGMRLSWNSQPGSNYQVLAQSTPVGTNWAALSPVMTAAGTTTAWTNTGLTTVTQRFYRVKQQ